MQRKGRWLYYIPVALFFPAILVNLGLLPLILDEATRGLVAQEMMHTGNFWVPTINGQLYFNKPPLYNWILVLFFSLTGSFDEFVLRMPMFLSLIGFGISVYHHSRKIFDFRIAFIISLAVVTSGRILFYDSARGLIDISYAWVTWMGMVVIYHQHQKQNYLKLFLLSWLFTALGFLMKGLPSLAFQGITLLIWFWHTGTFRKLFSLSHLAGLMLFLALSGGYFLMYSRFHSPLGFWERLFEESSKRTMLEVPVLETLIHLVGFPLEFIMHFLPWSILLAALLYRPVRGAIRKNAYLRFNVLVFAANIVIYWLSPAIYARYLFPFLPLFFTVLVWAFFRTWDRDLLVSDVVLWIFGILILALPLLALSFPFVDRLNKVEFPWLKTLLLVVPGFLFAWLYLKNKNQRLVIFTAALLLSRLGMSLFLQPERYWDGTERIEREGAKIAGRLTRGKEFYLYRDTPCQHATSYYINSKRGDILLRGYEDLPRDAFYLMPFDSTRHYNVTVMHSLQTRINALQLAVCKFKKE